MIATKVICNNTYSNKSQSIVSQSMFQLQDMNQMEWEMCQYLDWEVNVELMALKEFGVMVRKDFAGPGPCPTYILQLILKLAATSTNPYPAVVPNKYKFDTILRPSSSLTTETYTLSLHNHLEPSPLLHNTANPPHVARTPHPPHHRHHHPLPPVCSMTQQKSSPPRPRQASP